MKRYGVYPEKELKNDSDCFYDVISYGAPSSPPVKVNVYDRVLGGVCLYNITLASSRASTIIYNIGKMIVETYPTCVIPMAKDHYERFLLDALQQDDTPTPTSFYSIFIEQLFTGIVQKYIGDLTRLYISFTKLVNDFKQFSPTSYNREAFKQFIDNFVYFKQSEVKTYNVNETTGSSGTKTDNGTSESSATNKNANTPEIIEDMSEEEVLSSFISALAKTNTNNSVNNSSTESKSKNYNKRGDISTEKDHEHNLIEVFDSLKVDLYGILDKIVCELTISWDMG